MKETTDVLVSFNDGRSYKGKKLNYYSAIASGNVVKISGDINYSTNIREVKSFLFGRGDIDLTCSGNNLNARKYLNPTPHQEFNYEMGYLLILDQLEERFFINNTYHSTSDAEGNEADDDYCHRLSLTSLPKPGLGRDHLLSLIFSLHAKLAKYSLIDNALVFWDYLHAVCVGYRPVEKEVFNITNVIRWDHPSFMEADHEFFAVQDYPAHLRLHINSAEDKILMQNKAVLEKIYHIEDKEVFYQCLEEIIPKKFVKIHINYWDSIFNNK